MSKAEEVEKQLGDLTVRVSQLETPFWKRKSFWGGAAAVLLLAGIWLAPHVWDDEADPAIPRIVHQNIFLTDLALASALEQATGEEAAATPTANSKASQPLHDQLIEFVRDRVKLDSSINADLVRLVRQKQSRSYHSSRIYFPTEVRTASLACQIAQDTTLKTAFVDLMGGAEKIDTWCLNSDDELVIPFVDATPLIIPFHAKGSDNVEVSVTVEATDLADPDKSHRRSHEAFSLFLDESPTALELPEQDEIPGVSRLVLPVKGGERVHHLTLSLNEKGQEMLGLTKEDPPSAEETSLGARYGIVISAVVKVTRD